MKKLYLSIALMLLLAMTSISFAKADTVSVQVPFMGTIQGVESHIINYPWMSVDGNGSGNATLLGDLSLHYAGTVDLRTSAGTGFSAQFVAANGDTLYAEGYGQGNPTTDISYVTEWYTITGGTGRFTGATGSFVLQRQVNRTTGDFSGELDGTLVLIVGQ